MSERELPRFDKSTVSMHVSKDVTPETMKALAEMARYILEDLMVCPRCGGNRAAWKSDMTEFFCLDCRRYYKPRKLEER